MSELLPVTLCDECDHVHVSSRSLAPRRWLCTQHEKLPGFDGFVTGKQWEKDEPFLRCQMVNGGRCRLFKARRDGQMEIGDV